VDNQAGQVQRSRLQKNEDNSTKGSLIRDHLLLVPGEPPSPIAVRLSWITEKISYHRSEFSVPLKFLAKTEKKENPEQNAALGPNREQPKRRGALDDRGKTGAKGAGWREHGDERVGVGGERVVRRPIKGRILLVGSDCFRKLSNRSRKNSFKGSGIVSKESLCLKLENGTERLLKDTEGILDDYAKWKGVRRSIDRQLLLLAWRDQKDLYLGEGGRETRLTRKDGSLRQKLGLPAGGRGAQGVLLLGWDSGDPPTKERAHRISVHRLPSWDHFPLK